MIDLDQVERRRRTQANLAFALEEGVRRIKDAYEAPRPTRREVRQAIYQHQETVRAAAEHLKALSQQ